MRWCGCEHCPPPWWRPIRWWQYRRFVRRLTDDIWANSWDMEL